MFERREKQPKPPLLRWRGLLDELSSRKRLMIFAVLFACAVSMTFTQTGLAALELFGKDGYVVGLLGPMTMATFLLGNLAGVCMSALCGLSLVVHSQVQPLDYFEVVVSDTLPICALFVFTGLILCLGFSLALRTNPQGARRYRRIALVCILVSVLFTVSFYITALVQVTFDMLAYFDDAQAFEEAQAIRMLNRILSIGSPSLQIIVDAAFMISCCVSVDRLLLVTSRHADERPLRTTFKLWLVLVVFLGYVMTTAVGYVVITEREKHIAEDDMIEELEYLDVQRKELTFRNRMVDRLLSTMEDEQGTVKDASRYHFDMEGLLRGYEKGLDGIVIVAKGTDGSATVVASDSKAEVALGKTLDECLDPDAVAAILNSLESGRMRGTVYRTLSKSMAGDIAATRLSYVMALAFDGPSDGIDGDESYIYINFRPFTMVFADRAEVVVWMAAAAFVLMALVYVIVSHLLREVVLSPLNVVGEELGAITEGQLDTVVDAAGSLEFVGLSQGINSTVDALKDWIAEAQRRIEQELATAKAIQESAIPSLFPPFPEINEFDLYACMDPAREVGGDFYDFFLVEDGTLGFVIADVSGKGIPGALFMMAAKADLDNFMQSGMDLVEAVSRTNKRLCEGNDANMFVTAWVATLNYHTGLVTFVNAGHNPPLLRHNGSWTWINQKSGLFLGAFETAKFKSFQIQLEPGDELLLYTDGVNEAFSVEGEEYGNGRLEAFLQAHANLGPRDVVDELKVSVDSWAKGAEQSDDITIMALEYHSDK